MTYKKCPRCGQGRFLDVKCHCAQLEFHQENHHSKPEDFDIAYAIDEESLAIQMAEKDWDQEPGDPDTFEYVIKVRVPGQEWKEFCVTAHVEIDFTAQEVDKKGRARWMSNSI